MHGLLRLLRLFFNPRAADSVKNILQYRQPLAEGYSWDEVRWKMVGVVTKAPRVYSGGSIPDSRCHVLWSNGMLSTYTPAMTSGDCSGVHYGVENEVGSRRVETG
jgi:hypothetical protein